MAFSSSISEANRVFGSKSVTWGTFVNTAGSTGGDIDTGLKSCEFIYLQYSGTAVVTEAPVVNETLPITGNAITIVTTANADGYWFAIGTRD